jgi:hypothetical protein
MMEQDVKITVLSRHTKHGKDISTVIPHRQSEAAVRYIAKARGLEVYLSTRPCRYHGPCVVRDLDGCCTTCLGEGASRPRARR